MTERPPNLLQACEDGNLELVEAILYEQTPRQSTDDEWQQLLYRSLFQAIWNSDRLVVGALLDHGAKISGGCFGALVNKADIPVFEELAKHGLDVNAYIDQGETLLRSVRAPSMHKHGTWFHSPLIEEASLQALKGRRGEANTGQMASRTWRTA